MHENLESSKDEMENSGKLDEENVFSEEKLDDDNKVKHEEENYSLLDENLQENEQTKARRISLFDTNEEEKASESDDIHKKEPYLNYSSEETNEKIDLNNEFNQDTSDEKDQYEDKMPEEGKEEAEAIYDLNEPDARYAVAQREGQLERDGEVGYTQFQDVKMRVNEELNEMMKARR